MPKNKSPHMFAKVCKRKNLLHTFANTIQASITAIVNNIYLKDYSIAVILAISHDITFVPACRK